MGKFPENCSIPEQPKMAGTTIKVPTANKFEEFTFANSNQFYGLSENFVYEFFDPQEYVGKKDKLVREYTRKANNRTYNGIYLLVLAYTLNDAGEPVNKQLRWFDPAALIKRVFRVTKTPNEGETTVLQEGVRAVPYECEFNRKYAQYSAANLITDLVNNKKAIKAVRSEELQWVGYWTNGQRVPNTYIKDKVVYAEEVDAISK